MTEQTADIRPAESRAGLKHEGTPHSWWIAAGLISLSAVWLHYTFLTHAGALWRDEVNLVNLANLHSISELRQDSFPILFPLLVRVWSLFGWARTDLGLRCLGFLVGMGLVTAFWLAAWGAGRKPPLVSMSLIGLNATLLTYGDSLRAYGLGSAIIVLFLAAVAAYLQKPSGVRLLGATALGVASVQSLFHNAVLVAAVSLAAVVVGLRRRDYRLAGMVLLPGLVAAVSLVPYLKLFWLGMAPSAVWRTGFRPAFVYLDLHSAIGFPTNAYTWVWLTVVLFCVVIGLVPRCSCVPLELGGGNAGRELRLFLALSLILAVIGFGIFLWLAAVATQPWYFLPLLALVAASLDGGLPAMRPNLRAVVLALALGTAMLAFPMARVRALSRLTNVDLVANQLAHEAAPEDCVVVTPWFCGISFARYYEARATWQTLPPLEEHRLHRFDLISLDAGKKDILKPVLENVAQKLARGGRVWVVGTFEIPAPGTPLPADLPPPPLKDWGWSQIPYLQNWERQLTSFLRRHTEEFAYIAVKSSQDVNANENLKLAVAKGWRP